MPDGSAALVPLCYLSPRPVTQVPGDDADRGYCGDTVTWSVTLPSPKKELCTVYTNVC
jgi:hypothetical protein